METIHDTGLGNDFLEMTRKATKAKIDKCRLQKHDGDVPESPPLKQQ